MMSSSGNATKVRRQSKVSCLSALLLLLLFLPISAYAAEGIFREKGVHTVAAAGGGGNSQGNKWHATSNNKQSGATAVVQVNHFQASNSTGCATIGSSGFYGDAAASGDSLVVQYGDSIYLKGDWDAAPIVLEKYKLIFFTTAKVACTVFKKLFRRMMGFPDWNVEEYVRMLPWNPDANGLKYLYDYNRTAASSMMTFSSWVKAVFVREPKSRFLSAYIDKGVKHKTYLRDKCCSYNGQCVAPAKASADGFLDLIYYCDDAHWRPQNRRMEAKYWQHMNFIGHFEDLYNDTRRLLMQVGAWEEHGKTGWGPNGWASVFGETTAAKHATNADSRMTSYMSEELYARLEEYYAQDYANPTLNITKILL